MFRWLFSSRHKELKTLSSIIHGMVDPTICLDEEGRVLCVNSAVETLLKYKQQDMEGKSLSVFFPSLPAGSFFSSEMSQKAQGRKKDGSSILAELSMHEIPLGKRSVFSVVLHDLTTEEEEKKQKQKKSQSESSFLTSVSYELRTPLHAIMGFANVLLQEVDGSLLDEQKESLRRIKTAGEDLSFLIKGLLACYKEARPFFSFGKEFSSITAALIFSVDEVKGNLPSHVDILLDLPEEPCIVEGSTKVINQILLWVLQRAVYKTESGAITARVVRSEKDIEVVIEDAGKGITEEDLPHVFFPFSRPSFSEEEGLGLVLAKAFIEVLNGKIFVFSQERKGTVVKLLFPMYQQKHAEEKT